MSISQDIHTIILSYLIPNQLSHHFARHQLDHKIKFNYNLSTHHMKFPEFQTFVTSFPSIIINGISIDHTVKSLLNQEKFIKKLTIINGNMHCVLPNLRSITLDPMISCNPIVYIPPTIRFLSIKSSQAIVYVPHITRIKRLKTCVPINFTNKLPHLKYLNLALPIHPHINTHQSLTELSNNCPKLHTLKMTSYSIKNIDPINTFKSLKHLNIYDCLHLTSITLFCPPLARLTITNNPQLQSISTSESLNLISVTIINNSKLQSISIQESPKLISITIKDCPKSTLSTTSSNITHLNVQNSPLILFPTMISKLTHLIWLKSGPLKNIPSFLQSLTITNVSSLNFLKRCPNLRFLDVSSSPLHILSPLSYTPKLKHLNLSHCPIKHLNPIIFCKSIEYLNVSNCPLTSIKCISKLHNLKYLDISHCPLTDPRGLNHNNLHTVIMKYTTLLTIAPFTKCKNLKYLDLSHSIYEINTNALKDHVTIKITDAVPRWNLPLKNPYRSNK